MQPCEQYTAKEKVISKELERVSTRHNSLLKLGHAVVLQEKYENLRVLEIMRYHREDAQGVQIKTKECFKTPVWIWFRLSSGRGSHGKFPVGG